MANFMENFLGVKPPPTKKCKTREEILEQQKFYDKHKRERCFLPKWHRNRPWLLYSPPGSITPINTETESAKLSQNQLKGGSLKCNSCLNAMHISHDIALKNTFTSESGCTSLKLESIKYHEVSISHKKANKILHAQVKPTDTEAFKIIVTLNKEVYVKLDKMFRTCHSIALHNRPYQDFLWISEMDEAKGLTIGKTYRNVESAKVFTNAIAVVERKKCLKVFEGSKFLSVLSDGSTDTSIKEQELFYVRTAIAGQIQIFFVGIIETEKADSKGIFNSMNKAVVNFLQMPWDEFLSKLCSLGCDGASVMMGMRTGLYSLLKSVQPVIIAVHCFAHRIELAFKDSVKSLKLHEKAIETLLMGIYYFYHKSALNRALLKRSFKALDMKILMPSRVGGTRWVGHIARAITTIIKGYPAIVQHLEQVTDTDICQNLVSRDKAKCFLKLLTSKDVLKFLHLMLDVCEPVRKLSMVCQEETSTIADIHLSLKSTLAVLVHYKTNDGPYLRDVENISQELKGSEAAFHASRTKLLDGLETALNARFVDKYHEDVLQGTKILKFQNWPQSMEDSPDFGVKELQVAVKHYQPMLEAANVSVKQIEPEWTSLKCVLYTAAASEKRGLLNQSWQDINRQHSSGHENILSFVDLLLTIPASSSHVERGFSQLKLLKTENRSTLSEDHLNDLMSVKLLSEPVSSFNPGEAIDFWNSSGVRPKRPQLKDRVSKKVKSVSNEFDVVYVDKQGNEIDTVPKLPELINFSDEISVTNEPDAVDVQNDNESGPSLVNLLNEPVNDEPPSDNESDIDDLSDSDYFSESDYYEEHVNQMVAKHM